MKRLERCLDESSPSLARFAEVTSNLAKLGE